MKFAGYILKIFTFILCLVCPLAVYCETKPVSYEYLLTASEEEIAKIDVAEMNLACAEGLPGAEKLDIPYCLTMLDQWTVHARAKTERQMPMFLRDPGDYNDSLAYFKILVMVTALELDIGVKYDMELIKSGAMEDMKSTRFFHNSDDIFLHGILSFRRLGSCSSIPVLMVAVGRGESHVSYPGRSGSLPRATLIAR